MTVGEEVTEEHSEVGCPTTAGLDRESASSRWLDIICHRREKADNVISRNLGEATDRRRARREVLKEATQ
jgi:hypothetical protein